MMRDRRIFPAGTAFRALLALAALLALLAQPARAGVMDREAMHLAFPSPLIVGEKEADLPVWPIFKQEGTETPLIAYVFESIDLAPIPGFSGTPFNLLVALDAKGKFIDVRVLSQHEPVFVDGLGPEPLARFVEQYRGISLTQNIRIGTSIDRGERQGHSVAYLDGVAKATASIRILNQSLLAAALKVARARLGFAQGRDPDLVARIRPEVFQPLDWDGLVRAGLITRKAIGNREVEAAFADTVGAGQDAAVAAHPDDEFIELHVAHLGLPAVGRNLLHPAAWDYLQQRLDPGDHALLVVGRGPYSFLGSDFVRASVPGRLTLHQGELPIEIRDLDLSESLELLAPEYKLRLPAALRDAEWRVFRVIAPAGLDIAQPLDFSLAVTRSKGQFYPERVVRSFGFQARVPEAYFVAAAPDEKTWHSMWLDRAPELAVLGAALVLLFVVLWRQERLALDARNTRRFRIAFLLFTLVFIGWHAQGQLSIVNLTALVQAIAEGRSPGFFLYDPPTVVLWGFVLLTLVLWGRGTFCGWLCPFGALQELVEPLARALRIRQIRLSPRLDARLKWLKHGVLALILGTALGSAAWTARVVEIEPFKTSITLLFDRAWPYVLWAAIVILSGTVVYKGYCRYLCPLGAGLAILGRFRRLDWLTRRAECGKPCQRCWNDCRYQAIHRNGAIHYEECFQCLDCVVILQSDQLCVPRILERKKGPETHAAHPAAVIPIIEIAREGEPA